MILIKSIIIIMLILSLLVLSACEPENFKENIKEKLGFNDNKVFLMMANKSVSNNYYDLLGNFSNSSNLLNGTRIGQPNSFFEFNLFNGDFVGVGLVPILRCNGNILDICLFEQPLYLMNTFNMLDNATLESVELSADFVVNILNVPLDWTFQAGNFNAPFGTFNGSSAYLENKIVVPYVYPVAVLDVKCIDLSNQFSSAITIGGCGGNSVVGYAFYNQDFFSDAVSGDIAYRNQEGKILIGTEVNSSIMISNTSVKFKINITSDVLIGTNNTNLCITPEGVFYRC